MLSKYLTSAALAASIAFVPAARVAADGKDFIAGAIIGGVVGSQLQKNADRQRQTNRARSVAPSTNSQSVAPRQSYRPSIPITEEGRAIQSSLNYFGFEAGTVDGQVGPGTRNAISRYQTYMGYSATGQLTDFEKTLLLRAHNRAQAGGEDTFRQMAQHPDGTRGLLKVYRQEIASGSNGNNTSGSFNTDL